jgi:hypothetical protein
MPAPVVFLSFASEDAAWKANFANGEWFGNFLGPVEMFDYQMGDERPFGPMEGWLKGRVQTAAVFIAFVSKWYIEKRIPLVEWHAALPEACQGKLVFVPILLDGSAKQWWTDLKTKGRLRDLGDDYAYADFTDGTGKPCQIITDRGSVDRVTRKISELARLIKENLRQSAPPPTRRTAEHSAVVMGHPTAVSDPEVASLLRALVEKLSERGRPPIRWKDQWRTNVSARECPPNFTPENSIFIQPAGPGDAGDLAQDPRKLIGWLSHVLGRQTRHQSNPQEQRVILWLPESLEDKEFSAIVAKNSGDISKFALRHDDPAAFASWLRDELNDSKPLPQVPIVTLEEVDRNDDGKLRDALHSGFRTVVETVIQPPPETWTFQGEMLVKQISELESDRAIVAIHDLNTGTSSLRREARQQLEQKLGAVERDVERAKRMAGRSDLNLFWTALLVQKAEQLPWVKYPSPSRFEEWCLLPFAPPIQDSDAEEVVRPKPIEADVFRTYLRDWVHNRPPGVDRAAA